ncbi:hypothetical protein PG997_005629 [Apiospora hydei]|uniref:Apple domain-containing protein n=1 Tax=Apiospora hydei TaxID=1337664 RepID=A0ABR1WLH0_9PEZI
MPLPVLLEHRQSGSPCPGANGGQIGTLRQYNVLCGSRLVGKEIGGQQTASLGDCVDLCNDHAGPRCDGVVYQSNGHCILQAGINKGATTLDAGADSAIAAGMLQKPSSSCAALGSGTIQSANGMNFQITCKKVMSGNDFEVQFQMSFEDCMRACAKDGRCGGVSFEASQSFGFKNCYLKTPFSATSNQLLDQPSIDTARLTMRQRGNGNGNGNQNNQNNNNNGQANQPPPSPPPPETTMVEVTKTIVTSAPATIAITTTGADLATGGGDATVPGRRQRKTQGSLAPGSSAAGETTDPSEETDVSSMLQIAGPVAGAVAFLGIVGFAIFFFCRRRRRRRRQRQLRGEKGRWADLSDGREDGGSIWRDTTTTATTEVRDSRNGLKLNRVSTHAYGDPGIPHEFEGPHAVTK